MHHFNFGILIIFDLDQGNNHVWVNAYFDTQDGKMSGDCQCPIGNDNCNNIIKHYDGTVFDLSLITNCHFKNKQSCVGTLRNGRGNGESNRMLPMNCNGNKKMVCLYDCCKYPEIC